MRRGAGGWERCHFALLETREQKKRAVRGPAIRMRRWVGVEPWRARKTRRLPKETCIERWRSGGRTGYGALKR